MDSDIHGLDEEQEYHIAIYEWLSENNAIPKLENKDVSLHRKDGSDITKQFYAEFEGMFDGFEVSDDQIIEIFTTDFNVYRGDTVLYWDGSSWQYRYVRGEV